MSEPIASNIHPSLIDADAPAAVDGLCAAFGFTRRLVVPPPDGGVLHSELSLGPGVIMLSSPKPEQGRVAAGASAARSFALSVSVDDPDAHHARAVAAGAKVTQPLRDEQYGGRGYAAEDLEGNSWSVSSYRPGAHWEA